MRGAERRAKGHRYCEPASRPARPIQSTGAPAGKHADSLHHEQGHKIFQRGGSEHTVVKRVTGSLTRSPPSTSFLRTDQALTQSSRTILSPLLFCQSLMHFIEDAPLQQHSAVQTCPSTVAAENCFSLILSHRSFQRIYFNLLLQT